MQAEQAAKFYAGAGEIAKGRAGLLWEKAGALAELDEAALRQMLRGGGRPPPMNSLVGKTRGEVARAYVRRVYKAP